MYWLASPTMMDRRVKERLIGASILVVLVVLIVPELLSGPKRSAVPSAPLIPLASGAVEAVRHVTVDLATSKTPLDDASGASSAATAAAAPAGAPEGVARPAGSPAAGLPAAGLPDVDTPAVDRRAAAPAGAPSIMTLKAQQPTPSAPDGPAQAAPAPGLSVVDSAPSSAAASGVAVHHGWAVQLGSFASRANAEELVRRLRGDKVTVYVSSAGSGRALRFRVRAGPLPDRAAAERTLTRLTNAGHPGTLIAP